MRRGQTIVAEREHVISESERQEQRDRAKRKRIYSFLTVVSAVLLVVLLAAIGVRSWLDDMSYSNSVQPEKYEPTVEILDEGGTGYEQSTRVREFVGTIEHDFWDKGYTVARVAIPAGKTREIDVYLEGYEEYYKMNLDRGTAESVEDAVRMRKYLEERDLHPGYVDVRIEGKAYHN